MKKKLASLLVKWAMKLNPEATITAAVPTYMDYEAKSIGIGQELTKNDLRKFKQNNGEKSSRKAIKALIDETIKQHARRIADTAKGIIEVSVYKRGDSTFVESRLNVYVKKADNAEEPAEDGTESEGGE